MEFNGYFRAAQYTSRRLASIEKQKVNQVLLELADEAENQSNFLVEENRKDLERMPQTDPRYDRLLLNLQRIKDIASEIRNVAALESPLGAILEERTLPNGLHLSKIAVPLGVIGMIYESRPNVTFDVFSLCFKTGNACILKGGSDAEFSNIAIVKIIHDVLRKNDIDINSLVLLPPVREATAALLQASGFVDIIIPRGSKSLIDFVREHARVPVIETGAGIVHVYVDKSGDANIGAAIIDNAKTRRVSVCNALDCLLVHKDRLNDLPVMIKKLSDKNVVIYADDQSFLMLQNHYPAALLQPAESSHYGTEFLDYKMAIKTVQSLEEAMEHIHQYSSRHSECIVAEDQDTLKRFSAEIDAAVVYTNVSTAFTDGAQFGMGAEIGISTQKLHARGPMALKEITSYKWIVSGNGQVRN
ncbi:MAG: glutamate-5-semialdehyde dehydrogenase [Ferruginibacter sp.]|nr:glutamate-5-semialdehyde dehydrogenase [Ferruginibacter sp.]